jgi:hypothetical protein
MTFESVPNYDDVMKESSLTFLTYIWLRPLFLGQSVPTLLTG